MTLRELCWAVQGRMESLGELNADLKHWMGGLWGAKRMGIDQMNAFRRREPEKPKTAEQIKVESKLAFKLLDELASGEVQTFTLG